MAEVVVVVPLWRRTSGIDRVTRSLVSTAGDRARVLFVVSQFDDDALTAVNQHGHEPIVVSGHGGGGGDYARKINAGMRASNEPFIFTGADDIEFHDGWLDACEGAMGPGIGVVGTVDGCNGRTADGSHSTHSFVARWWTAHAVFDAPDSIYSELYDHEYCDDELCQRAQASGAYAHAFDAFVEHHHPNIMKAELDETYMRGRARTRVSRMTYLRRRHQWGVHG